MVTFLNDRIGIAFYIDIFLFVQILQVPSMLLPKLKSLDLSYNNLPTIPVDTTANLTRLRKLDISYNDLSTVPVVSSDD